MVAEPLPTIAHSVYFCSHLQASCSSLMVVSATVPQLCVESLLSLQDSFFEIADFSSVQRFSMSSLSGLIAGQFKTVHLFLFNHSFMLLHVCCGSLSCWKTQDLHLNSSFQPLVNTFHLLLWFHRASSTRGSKAAPQPDRTSTIFYCRQGALAYKQTETLY